MKKRRNRSFKNKLYTAFVTVWIVPIVLLTISDYWYMYQSTVQHADMYTRSNLKIAAQMIDSDLAAFGGIVNSMATNDEVADIIARDQQGKRTNFEETQRLYSVTQIAMASLPQSVPIHIVNSTGSSRYSTTNYFLPIYNNARGNLYDAMNDNLTTGKISAQTHWRVDGSAAEDINYVLGRAIIEPDGGDVIGYVILDIFNSYFQSAFQMIATYEGSNILALDHLNYAIADMQNLYYPGYRFDSGGHLSASADGDEKHFDLTMDGTAYKAYYEVAETSKIKVVELIPKSYFVMETLRVVRTHLLFFVVLILLGALVVIRTAGQMVSPIKQLEAAINQVEAEDYTARVDIAGDDEIAHLGQSFNDMASHIQHLIEENYRGQILLQQAEVKALKAQTNPHFLYNCLNSIYMMATLDQKDDVLAMTRSLSKYYRNRVNTEADIVPLGEELEQAFNYLHIQSLRYREKLQVHRDIEDGLADIPVLKLILQPLVENAVLHGIEQLVGKGEIWVRAWRDGDRLRIEVTDNGNGPGSSTHVGEKTGLLNTKMRLGYHYGQDFDFSLTRRENVTVAALNLPLEEKP